MANQYPSAQFVNDVLLWSLATDMDRYTQGPAVAMQLGGPAKTVVRQIIERLGGYLDIQQGRQERAADLYRQLSAESIGDARPVLAVDMLRGEQGRAHDMQVLLHEARLRRGLEAVGDPLIDAVAARWCLKALRQRPPHSASKL